jgi:hypothetical protein
MGNMLIVNSPYFFSGVWSMIKTFLDERTRGKIRIMSNGWKPVLLEYCDADTLPDFLGGTCTCEDNGGDCMRSNIGPWNDWEITKPKGIHRKEAVVEEVVE